MRAISVSIERRLLSIDNSHGSTDGGQPCGGRCNFFVPCVPYCAHRDATSRRADDAFSGISPSPVDYVVTKNEALLFYRTALLYVVPLLHAAYYRSISAQNVARMLGGDGQRAVFAWKRRQRRFVHRRFQRTKRGFARGELVAATAENKFTRCRLLLCNVHSK